MAAITGTRVFIGELAGNVRLLEVTATVGSASDTITLSPASHNVQTGSIVSVLAANIETGQGANFQSLHCSVSGLVITIASLNGAGGAATTFGNVRLLVKVSEANI